jgi:FkbM family methyltransferase
MTRARSLGKRLLRRRNLIVVRLPTDAATGQDLAADLRVAIGRPDPLCLDVGANEGQTIRLLQRAFRAPRIHAFEPSRATYESLASQAFGERVWLYPVALGETAGVRELLRFERSDLSSLLEMDVAAENRFRSEPVAQRERVTVETVDGFLQARGIEVVDLLKIDTQGFDLHVLQGAVEALQAGRVRHVLVELNFVPMYVGQASPVAILAFLERHGLSLVDLYEKVRQGQALAWCSALFRAESP